MIRGGAGELLAWGVFGAFFLSAGLAAVLVIAQVRGKLMRDVFYRSLASVLDDMLEEECGERIGFCLLTFPFRRHETAGGVAIGGEYVSNCKRADMIKVLRETADRLEAGQEIGAPAGQA